MTANLVTGVLGLPPTPVIPQARQFGPGRRSSRGE
jgi:hypothetical protein